MATDASGLLNMMDDENDWINLMYVAEAIVPLEVDDPEDQKEMQMQKANQECRTISDLRSNGKRGVLQFFAKRMSCNCLTEKYQEAKQQHVKMGQCFGCIETIEFNSLMRCLRCKVAHYCSTECQQSDWPEHKTFCVKKPPKKGKARHCSATRICKIN